MPRQEWLDEGELQRVSSVSRTKLVRGVTTNELLLDVIFATLLGTNGETLSELWENGISGGYSR